MTRQAEATIISSEAPPQVGLSAASPLTLSEPTTFSVSDLFAHGPGLARERILELETAMRDAAARGTFKENTDEMPLEHFFIPGCYARQLTIPKGTILVGKIHRMPCFNVVLCGEITVLTEDGVKLIKAPAFFRSEANLKRVGYAHSDTVWINVHPTNEIDLDRLEEELILPSYAPSLVKEVA